ncbi:MAG: hypothetical protein JKY25_10085 [Robiginitomaculum sp.]|nr:hypothetical protein [Robiginitomaculum sp.]
MSKTSPMKPGDLSPRAQYLIERHGSVILIWLLFMFLSWTRNSASLLRGELPGNDDYMRMAEIRDWLGGQSWFDLHQYRLNPVEPLNAHWSRISDVLIGGPIKVLTPILGPAKAELAIIIAYPSILLLIYLYLATAIARKLSDNRAVPLIAAFMLVLSFGALAQFGMGRIDHHGLQIVMALATCWFIITSKNNPNALIYAGILCGFGLYVGIESAPYVAAACIAVSLIWVFAEDEAARKLRVFGLALALTTLLSLLVSTTPENWFAPSCDALSVVYTQLTLLIAVILWGLSFAGRTIKTPMTRFFLAGAFGAAALLITIVLYPQCLKGPYAGLDSRLVEIWLSNVAEAKNFAKFVRADLATGIATIVLPMLAILAYVFVSKKQGGLLGLRHRTLILFVIMTLFAGLLQARLMFFATALSIPLATLLLINTLQWAGRFKSKPKKLLVSIGLVIAMTPVTLPLIILALSKQKPETVSESTELQCISQPVLAHLNALPPGTALTQIDLGAPVLHFTKLSVTSAPYHRNASGILAALDMFIEDEVVAKKAVTDMKADYVIACRNSNETNLMLKYGPNGMLAQLIAGKTPTWLEAVDIGSGDELLVYRVVRPQP